jgi:hypothetical protein
MPANDYVVIASDPFAREDLIRETEATHRGCDWCGSTRKSGRLFRYGSCSPMGRTSWFSRLFCSVSCFRTYTS